MALNSVNYICMVKSKIVEYYSFGFLWGVVTSLLLPLLLQLFMGSMAGAALVSVWSTSTVPSLVDGGPDSPVELGARFRTDVAGSVVGIRFYKSTANTGNHVANLWTTAGAKLATAAFANETASGWQQVNFSTPVSISASTVYIASYSALNGHYSADLNYFATKGVDNYPLHVLANSGSAGDGVYAYGAGSSFPASTYKSTNYWVDVLFQSGTQSGTAPSVTSISPPLNAAGVSLTSTLSLSFGDAMNVSTINSSNIFLVDPANATIPAAVNYNAATNIASLAPSSPLKIGTVYKAIVKGGPSGVADLSGNTMSSDFSWTFATASSYGAQSGGPGGPILVITDPSNPFSAYYAEILLTEGFNEFALAPVSSLTSATLAQYDIAILGQFALTGSQAAMISNWVNAGGNLIAMRPDKQLAGLLGLLDAGSTLPEGYLLVNTGSGAGRGIVGQAIQFHGTADCYALASATSLAMLYSSRKKQKNVHRMEMK